MDDGSYDVTGGDDALLADMLALLEDDDSLHQLFPPRTTSPALPVVSPVSHEPPPKKPTRGIGSTARRKLAIDALRAELQQLNDQLVRLRGSDTALAGDSFQCAKEHAMGERLHRRRAEQECDALRRAVFQQMQFVRGLRGLVSGGPGASLGLNLCHYLHNFTRLPRDRATRQSEYIALSRVDRLDMAMELLLHETGMISVVDAHLQTDYTHESEISCSASTLSVFTMECGDVGAVLGAACVAMREILAHSRPFENVGLHGEIIDADVLSHNNIQYRATSVHKRSDEAGDLSIESLEVSIYRLADDAAVMLWDFVDEDDLVPLGEVPDISRQSVGACLIRREMCPDGVARVVYRELSMRRYLYRGDAPSPPLSVQRYFASKSSSVGPNELVYRDLMARQILQEEKATQRVP